MARLSCEAPIELRAGNYVARIAPAAGGRIVSLAWCGQHATVPLLVAWDGLAFDEHDWPKAGAFPMLPFANRLPAEGFAFGGRLVRPEPGPTGFAQHGLAHRRPWTVTEASGQHVLLQFAHDGNSAGWPWAWTAQQAIHLDEGGLTLHLSVRNDSAQAMPLAIGWHPYHPVRAGVASEDLRFRASARRDLDAGGCAGDQAQAPAFAMERGETAAFSGWDGRAQLAGAGLAVAAQGAANLVLHRPMQGNYLCIEPVTILPGHLGRAGAEAVLQPGQSRSLTWACSLQE